MVESIRKWKYATFAVLGVLALVIATPTAFAAPSSSGTDISKTVLDILKNSQTLLTQSSSISSTTTATQNAVTNPQNGLPAIQAQLNELQEDVDELGDGIKTARGNIVLENDAFDILGDEDVEDAVYSGHITIMEQTGDDKMSLICGLSDSDSNTFSAVTAPLAEVASFPEFTTVEFNCNVLRVTVTDTDGSPSNALYAVEYTVDTESEELDTDPSSPE